MSIQEYTVSSRLHGMIENTSSFGKTSSLSSTFCDKSEHFTTEKNPLRKCVVCKANVRDYCVACLLYLSLAKKIKSS